MDQRKLIEESRRGSPEAFGQLVHLHRPRLLKAMGRVVDCDAEAEDVVQDAFMLAYRNLPKFQGRSDFYTWLYRIARNQAISRHRKVRLRRSPTLFEQLHRASADTRHVEPTGLAEQKEQQHRLRVALSRLTVAHRRVLELRNWQDFDYETIGATLGVSIGTVKSRLHRAKQMLRQELCRLD